MKRWAIRGLIMLAGLLLGLGIAELGLRVIDPFGISYHEQNRRFFDPEEGAVIRHDFGHRLKANLDIDVGFPVKTNEHGLREPSFSPQKPDDEYRILLLGDSVVFGWGVEEAVTFAHHLEGAIQEALPPEAQSRRVRVLNGGCPGWNVADEARYLRDCGLAFQPDMVMVVFIPDDVPHQVSAEDRVDRDQKLGAFGRFMFSETMEPLYLKQFIKHLYWLGLQDKGVLEETVGVRNFDQQPQARILYREVLKGIVAMTNEAGAQFVFVDCLGRDYARGFASELEIPYVTILPNVSVTPPEYRVSDVDGHPNAACHQMMTEKILAGLRDHQLLEAMAR